MNIYDEITRQQISSPDLKKGYLYSGQIEIGREPSRLEVMPGTISEINPNGLRQEILGDIILEDCQFYHAYSEEEIKAQQISFIQLPQQINSNDINLIWNELANAYNEGVEEA